MIKLWSKRTKVLDEVEAELELMEDKTTEEALSGIELTEELKQDYESHWRNGYVWGFVAGAAGAYLITKNRKS